MPFAPPNPDDKDMRRMAFAVGELGKGRSNAVGSVTLTTSVASTAVTAQNCGAASAVLLQPTTSTAAAEIGAGTAWVSSVIDGGFWISHATSSVATRTFNYVCLG